MTLIEWQDAYSVGADALDRDHKRLIDIINRIAEADDAGRPVGWALDALDDYARGHFRREEAMMKAAGYAELPAHAGEHKAFLEWLRSVKATLHLDAQAQYYLAATLKSYLRDWLNGHILESDMRYKGKIGAAAGHAEPARNGPIAPAA